MIFLCGKSCELKWLNSASLQPRGEVTAKSNTPIVSDSHIPLHAGENRVEARYEKHTVRRTACVSKQCRNHQSFTNFEQKMCEIFQCNNYLFSNENYQNRVLRTCESAQTQHKGHVMSLGHVEAGATSVSFSRSKYSVFCPWLT